LHELQKIQLQDLPASGWHWHADVPRSQLEDEQCGHVDALHMLNSDARWDVDLQRQGGCYHLSGSWQARVGRDCSRCNAAFEMDMQGETLRVFQLAKGATGEDDVLPLPGKVNLLDVLREDIWLAWRLTVVCKPDCKGLCQRCGKDLNDGPCACPTDDGDHPFAALRTLKLDK